MGFVAALVVSLIVMVVGELLRPKQKPMNAKASSIDDFSFPTAEEGRSIPIVCGKVKIAGANVTWYGDLLVIPLKKKVKTGLWSSAMQTYAHQYKMGMQMALCHSRPDFQVHEVLFGDKMPAYARTDEANGVVKFAFDDINFYGGNEKEGGVQGTMRVYRGYDTQEPSAYFSTQIGETGPGYRGLAYAMLEQMYLGTSPYIKTVGYIVSSYPNTLGVPSNHHIIGEDANPVCFIYEIINDPKWGLNIASSRFNLTGWRAAAETCYSEGYGISMIINGSSSGEDLIGEILRHIDGVVYTDPQTGLLEIRLARADYDVNALPVFGPDDFLEGIKFSRPLWSQTKNTIKVTYVDRSANYTEAVVSQQDLSNITQRGGEIYTEEIQFLGFSSFAAADRACARALKTLSYPLSKVSCAMNRKAWTMRPGSVFKLDWPARGMSGVVMRVIRIDYGNLKQNRIDIEAVEDIFAISQSAYVQPPPSGWVDPVQAPAPLVRSDLLELPYPFAQSKSIYIATLGSRSSGIDEGYDVWSGAATGDVNKTYKTRVGDFTPSGVLTAAYPNTTPSRDPTGFALTSIVHGEEIPAAVTEDALLAGDSVALIRSGAGDEFVAFKNFNGTQVSDVIRGIYGTTMLNHPTGATFWFLSGGFGVENEEPYSLPKTVYAKLLPFNIRGVLPLASATEKSVVATGRALLPYPPKLLKVNGSSSPGTIQGDATLTWEWRNIDVMQGAVDVGGVTDPLPYGSSYTVTVRVGGVLKRTITGLTSASFTYTAAMQSADGYGSVEFRVKYVPASGSQSIETSITYTSQQAPGVVSLLHFDGTDGSTTFTDEKGKTWTASGNAQIDTAQSKFGGASGLFDGAGDYITTPNHTDFDFGSDNFTVEIQRRGNSLAGNSYQGLVCHDQIGGTRGWLLFTGDDSETTPDGLQFAAFVGGTAYTVKDTVSAGTGTWQHVAAVRDGNTLRLYKDGVQVGSTAITGSINNPSQPCVVGALWTGSAGSFFNGWIDELRISKGICQYPNGTTFTPPSAPFT